MLSSARFSKGSVALCIAASLIVQCSVLSSFLVSASRSFVAGLLLAIEASLIVQCSVLSSFLVLASRSSFTGLVLAIAASLIVQCSVLSSFLVSAGRSVLAGLVFSCVSSASTAWSSFFGPSAVSVSEEPWKSEGLLAVLLARRDFQPEVPLMHRSTTISSSFFIDFRLFFLLRSQDETDDGSSLTPLELALALALALALDTS